LITVGGGVGAATAFVTAALLLCYFRNRRRGGTPESDDKRVLPIRSPTPRPPTVPIPSHAKTSFKAWQENPLTQTQHQPHHHHHHVSSKSPATESDTSFDQNPLHISKSWLQFPPPSNITIPDPSNSLNSSPRSKKSASRTSSPRREANASSSSSKLISRKSSAVEISSMVV
jgi:hypothetical protein